MQKNSHGSFHGWYMVRSHSPAAFILAVSFYHGGIWLSDETGEIIFEVAYVLLDSDVRAGKLRRQPAECSYVVALKAAEAGPGCEL